MSLLFFCTLWYEIHVKLQNKHGWVEDFFTCTAYEILSTTTKNKIVLHSGNNGRLSNCSKFPAVAESQTLTNTNELI